MMLGGQFFNKRFYLLLGRNRIGIGYKAASLIFVQTLGLFGNTDEFIFHLIYQI
jgi:hypothetical protein